MGEIKPTVPRDRLPTRIENTLGAFTHVASITWYRECVKRGTTLHAFLVKLDRALAEAGYEEEMLLVCCPYATLEPRSLRIVEELFADPEIFGRIEPYAFFLVSDAADAKNKFEEIGGNYFPTKTAVVFTTDEILQNANDAWFVRQRFLEKIASRDLFDVRLPLKDDFGFFGRKDALNTILDSIRRSENVGIFGLRKVGKTSLLYRARDICLSQDTAQVALIDCKSPDIWTKSWDQLLAAILVQLEFITDAQSVTRNSAASVFAKCIVASKRRIVLIFDEIEFISPDSSTAPSWKENFVPFWQTIWAAQSETKKLSVIVAGVDSNLLERSQIGKSQNPLFSIVKPLPLRGLADVDLRSMVRQLGRKSGLSIEFEPAMWLFRRYGGHPLITRIACSVLNNYIKEQGSPRPFIVTTTFLDNCAEYLDSSVLYYAEHVVASLKDSFAAEFRLIVALALGRKSDFYDQAKNPNSTRHLREYGIVDIGDDSAHRITIDVIRQYIVADYTLNNRSSGSRWIVPPGQRTNWVKERSYRILKDFRMYDKLRQSRGDILFGPNTLPEAEIFAYSSVVMNERDWEVFINATNRTFVESVEQYGKSAQRKDYFWNDFKQSSPALWHALNRIKMYRNEEMHLVLTGQVIANYKQILLEDFGTVSLGSHGNDIYFLLQQVVLDGVLNGLQVDTARFDR